jgi:hypothetical protein
VPIYDAFIPHGLPYPDDLAAALVDNVSEI